MSKASGLNRVKAYTKWGDLGHEKIIFGYGIIDFSVYEVHESWVLSCKLWFGN